MKTPDALSQAKTFIAGMVLAFAIVLLMGASHANQGAGRYQITSMLDSNEHERVLRVDTRTGEIDQWFQRGGGNWGRSTVARGELTE